VPTIEWSEVLGLTISPWELMFRGTAVYWFLFLAFRLLVRRELGTIAMSDMLLVILVGDAAQNAMSSEYRSVTDGIILVSTILGWNVLVDWIAYRSPRMRRLLNPSKLTLVKDGAILRHNLRKEMLTVDELEQELREHGVDDVSEVSAAYMESDGKVTVLKRR
jgi:uncharacterized membrane protein YcaP (DUF421 family)